MNRETREHLITDVLPVAAWHLRAVGCDSIDPFTLAVTAWPGDPPESDLSAADRESFNGLHLAACTLLGEQPSSAHLRPIDLRRDDEIDCLVAAYRWAGLAQHNHAAAWRAFVDKGAR